MEHCKNVRFIYPTSLVRFDGLNIPTKGAYTVLGVIFKGTFLKVNIVAPSLIEIYFSAMVRS